MNEDAPQDVTSTLLDHQSDRLKPTVSRLADIVRAKYRVR